MNIHTKHHTHDAAKRKTSNVTEKNNEIRNSMNSLLKQLLSLICWLGDRPLAFGAGNLSQYITSRPRQLSLANSLCVGTLSTSQRAEMLCGWGVKAGMVHEWVAGKTV